MKTLNYKKLLLTTFILTLLIIPTYAQNTFLTDLNTTIDSAQEKLNNAAEDIDAAIEKVDQVIDDTKVIVEETVEAITVALSDLDDHWAKQYIDDLIGKKVVSGYPDGTFKPNAPISVSEFTKILMAGTYEDTDYQVSTPWYQSYLDEALEIGIIESSEFNDYTREITRYEMARMIARAAEDQDKLKITETSATKFQDDSDITSTGKKFITAVSDVGIITGYPNGDFGPNNEATRAEASVMLNRLLDLKTSEKTVQEKTVVEQMLENVLASKMVSPTSISRIQQLVDKEETIFCRGGSYMEDGVLKVGDYTNFQSAIDNALKIGQVLQPHAEANDLMVAITGGQGVTMSAKYGESVDKLNRDLEMFSISYYRDVEWANEVEIDGDVYEVDRRVMIGGGLFANKRLERAIPVSEERRKYRRKYIDMDEDVLNAFYDGLRAMDPNRAEALFDKMTTDYIYAKTHQYGDPNNSRKEFFEIDGLLIYQEDIRDADGRYRYITYRFVK